METIDRLIMGKFFVCAMGMHIFDFYDRSFFVIKSYHNCKKGLVSLIPHFFTKIPGFFRVLSKMFLFW